MPFLFMGCWNRAGPARNHVAAALCDNPIENLVLGGDNIYPEKSVNTSGMKTKKYSRNVFDQGIAALKCKRILGTALGNHNISDRDILKTQMESLTSGQNYYIQNYPDVNLIFLDSNLSGKDATTMFAWLATELEKMDRNYFLIQHEPLLAFKKHKIHQYQQLAPLLDILIRRPPLAVLCADTHHYQQGVITYRGRNYSAICCWNRRCGT